MQIKIFFEGTEYSALGRKSILPDAAEALGLESVTHRGLFCKEWIIIHVPDTYSAEHYIERLKKIDVRAVLQSSTHSLQHLRATPRDKPKPKRR